MINKWEMGRFKIIIRILSKDKIICKRVIRRKEIIHKLIAILIYFKDLLVRR